jgi:phosphopantetheinyl transferase
VTPRVRVWVFAIEGKADANAKLRQLLARQLKVSLEEVVITTRRDGKPAIRRGEGHADLRFNLSHSGHVGVVAIADGIEVGIDVEQVTERRPAAYLREWTRHEAYVKALGVGLRQRQEDPRSGWRVIDLDLLPGYVAALAAQSEVDVSVRVDAALAESGEDRGGDPQVLDREPG